MTRTPPSPWSPAGKLSSSSSSSSTPGTPTGRRASSISSLPASRRTSMDSNGRTGRTPAKGRGRGKRSMSKGSSHRQLPRQQAGEQGEELKVYSYIQPIGNGVSKHSSLPSASTPSSSSSSSHNNLTDWQQHSKRTGTGKGFEGSQGRGKGEPQGLPSSLSLGQMRTVPISHIPYELLGEDVA